MPGSPRHNRKLHEERLKPREIKPNYKNVGEAEVVPGYQLSEILRKWVVRFLDGRHPHENFKGIVGPIDYLSMHTEIHIRRVSAIVNGEFVVVPLSQADKLLTLIGENHLLNNGEIQVVPNPNWSFEKWVKHMRKRGCM